MGVNKRSRMGKCKEDKIPTIVTSTTDLNPVQISTSRNSTLILTEAGDLYSTG